MASLLTNKKILELKKKLIADTDINRKLNLLYIVNFITILTVVLFAGRSFVQGFKIQTYVEICVFAVLSANTYWWIRNRNFSIYSNVTNTILCLTFIFLYSTGTSSALWILTYPWIVVVVVGKRKGKFYNLLIFISLVIISFFDLFLYDVDLSIDLKIRFPFVFLVVSIIAYYNENSLEKIWKREKESESLLKGIFKSTPVGVYTTSSKSINWINYMITSITGYEEEDLVGRTTEILYSDKDEYVFVDKEINRQLISEGLEIGTVETKWKRKDESLIDVLLNFVIVKNSNGEDTVVCSAIDVTEQKRIIKLMFIQRDVNLLLSMKNKLSDSMRNLLEFICLGIRGIDAGGVYLLNKKKQRLELVSHYNLEEEFVERTKYFEKDSFQYSLIKKKNPVYTDYSNVNMVSDVVGGDFGIKALGVIPIVKNDNIIAVLNIASFKYQEFSYETRGTLETIASQIGSLVETSILQEEHLSLLNKSRVILEAIPDVVIEIDSNGKTVWTNEAGYNFFGRDIIGKQYNEYFVSEEDLFDTLKRVSKTDKGIMYVENRVKNKYGEICILVWRGSLFFNKNEEDTRIILTARDITEEKKLVEQLEQSRKMDAIGQLAGGVAHDFNNQLMGISGFTELVKMKSGDNDDIKRYATSILKSVERATSLTKHLLAFARKGKFLSIFVDVHSIIDETVDLLEQSIDKRIRVKKNFNATSFKIKGDPSQLQNAFLNVALNSRDAMPNGGTLSFTTEDVVLDSEFCNKASFKIKPGKYLKVIISDTGVGMTKDIAKHIFEPFFTTKDLDKGTGLGLAAVYGTVKNHGGFILVDSEVGKGATFNMYFPLSGVTEDRNNKDVSLKPQSHKSINIMIVDDEEEITSMISEFLKHAGHTIVQVCSTGNEAFKYYKEYYNSIDVVLLDMNMPEMDGQEVFEKMYEVNPSVKVIIMSGYSLNNNVQTVIDKGAKGFIQKPFSVSMLLAKIIQVFG